MGAIEGIGLLQTYNIYCPPKTATLAQMVRVILAYIEGHPERMHEDFRLLAAEAMNKAWPCSK